MSRASLWLALVVLCASNLARATPETGNKERARQLLSDGNARYAASDFVGALALFRRAYAAYPSPKLLVNTAACHGALGRDDRMATDLAEYLRQYERDRAIDQRTLADGARADLRRVEDLLGRVVVEGLDDDGRVVIDDEPGRLVTYVAPGDHHVVVWRGDGVVFDRHLTARAGRSEVVHTPARVVPSVVIPVAPPPVLVNTPPPPRRRRWVLPVAITSAVVVGGLALGLGLGLGLRDRSGGKLSGDLGTISFGP